MTPSDRSDETGEDSPDRDPAEEQAERWAARRRAGPALTRAQVRELDRLAVEELGIPSIVLMENAAKNAAAVALSILEEDLHLIPADALVAVLCGGGNNGGDGLAIARHLHNQGVSVRIFLAKDPGANPGAGNPGAGDAACNLNIVERMGLEPMPVLEATQLAEAEAQWAAASLFVDALLGTGFTGRVQGFLPHLIDALNHARQGGAKVLAVDVPSGLDCDTGRPSDATVIADVTVTFAAMKRGFLEPAAEPYLGDVLVVDIGAPPELLVRVAAMGA